MSTELKKAMEEVAVAAGVIEAPEAPATEKPENTAQTTENAPAKAEGTEQAPTPGTEKETAASDENDAESETPAAAYKPRDKFKVMVYGSDEQKEHDVPDWLKATIKDEASEKQVIELLEKAYGLEPVKAARAAVAKERDTVKTELGQVQRTIQDVRTTYQRGDIDEFLRKLSIPQERMLQWALDKVNYSQLPPEQQRVLDERTDAQRKAWLAEQQTMSVETQLQEQTRQAKQVLLQSSLARPDVHSFSSAYDARAGKQGAFFEEVKATGELAWIQSNGQVDLTPDQAIEQVMKKWGAFLQPTQAAPSTQSPQAPVKDDPASKVVVPTTSKSAVIPNVKGGSQSPMKSGPRSLEDLKKLGKQMNG